MKSLRQRWRLSRSLDDGWPVPPSTATRLSTDEDLRGWRDSLLEVDRRLRRGVERTPAPSPELRNRILAALHREAGAPDPEVRPGAPPSPAVRVFVLAAAALLAILVWDPFHTTPGSSSPAESPPSEVVVRLLETLSEPVGTPSVDASRFTDVVDLPLRREMTHLVEDTTRVVEGVASSLSDTVLGPLAVVGSVARGEQPPR